MEVTDIDNATPCHQSTLFSHINADKYASKIAHCVHLHFDLGAGGLGANLGIMPLAVAWFYLDRLATKTDDQVEMFKLVNELLEKPSVDLYASRFLVSLRHITSRPSTQDGDIEF